MVRKPSKLKQNTDMKVDGAYADIVVPPQTKGDSLGQTKNLQTQVDAVGGPLAQEVAATGGMPNVDNLPVMSGDQLFDAPTQLPDQPGNTITFAGSDLGGSGSLIVTLRSDDLTGDILTNDAGTIQLSGGATIVNENDEKAADLNYGGSDPATKTATAS